MPSLPTVLLLIGLFAVGVPMATAVSVGPDPGEAAIGGARSDVSTAALAEALGRLDRPEAGIALAFALQGDGPPGAADLSEQDLHGMAARLAARAPGPVDRAEAVAIAKDMSRGQAHALGLAWGEPLALDGHDTPSDALTTLTTRLGVRPTAAEVDDMTALDALPPAVAHALTRFVDSFLALQTASRHAFGHLGEDAWARQLALEEAALARHHAGLSPTAAPSPGASLAAMGIDLSTYFPTRDRFLDAAMALREVLEDDGVPTSATCTPTTVPPAFSIVLEACDDTYTADYALVVDAGGNDVYRNNAGGTGSGPMLSSGRCSIPVDALSYAAALVDLGGGNDQYGQDGNHRCGGVNGGGAQGTGFLLDDGGDDAYRAFGLGVNGGGAIGAGALLDLGGHDQYRAGMGARCTYVTCYAGSHGVNGGANLGAGSILDTSGDDEYLVAVGVSCAACDMGGSGVNGGATLGGVAGIVDLDGSDRYEVAVGSRCTGWAVNDCTAGALGVNGGSFAGRGVLFDGGAQDDVFEVGNGAVCTTVNLCMIGSTGINGGASVGSGFLFNGGGHDTYRVSNGATCSAAECRVGQDGVNGGGSGLSGALVDAGGNDLYLVATGSSCTASVDCRFAVWGVNGAGLIGGLGRLIDASGDDRYDAASGTTCGGAFCQVATLGVNGGAVAATGHILDGSGDDVYTVAEGAGCTASTCHVAEYGTNGGVGGSPGGAAQGGIAFLLDGGGTDRYHDAFSSCMDCTVVPKEINGAQVDVSSL